MAEQDVHYREDIGKTGCGYEAHAVDQLESLRYTWCETDVTCPECIAAYDPPLFARQAV